MSQAKHTPGPWTAELCSGRSWTILDERGERVAFTMPSRGTDLHPTDADARLIAAAPELLAILKPFIEIWSDGDSDYQKRMDDYWRYDNLSAARAAIAKAEGRTPCFGTLFESEKIKADEALP